MTVISNNCASANFYKLNGLQYNHPFFWCINDFRFHGFSYIDWYTNFYDIDYCDVEFGYDSNWDLHIGRYTRYCYTKVNNKFISYYMHYILNDIEMKDQLSYYSPNIMEYCQKKYFDRVKRIKKDNIYFLIDMYRSNYKNNCSFSSVSISDNELKRLSEYDNVYCFTSNLKEDEHVRDIFNNKNLCIIEEFTNDSALTIAERFSKIYHEL